MYAIALLVCAGINLSARTSYCARSASARVGYMTMTITRCRWYRRVERREVVDDESAVNDVRTKESYR